MQIWVDADACPKMAKEILFRVAIRTKIKLIMVANRLSHVPISPYISTITVPAGFDEADKRIEAEVSAGDLVITADIPLADAVVTKGCLVLNPRGTLYSQENIKQQLAMRNLMTQLREERLISGGSPSYSNKDTQALASQLNKILEKAKF